MNIVLTQMKFKYHKQYRLQEFDYSSNNGYFITIVTKNREHFFGEIMNQEMFITEIGVFLEDNFKSIEKDILHLKIHEYIIMPNHIHLIAVINNSEKKDHQYSKGLQPLIPKSISSFVNHFKGTTKKWCNNNGFENFEWQPRFHDRIIRNKEEYQAIRYYIRNNIKNWESDKEY